MARNKKAQIKEYSPSKYQVAIFDYIANGKGNLVVEAAAGSGKSYTLVKSLELIPQDKSVLMVAFNRDIVKELQKKVKGFDNVSVKTIHSLGLHMMKNNFGFDCGIPEMFKYDSFIKDNISELSSLNVRRLGRNTFVKYIGNIKRYVDFGRYYLCENVDDLSFIEERYNIETLFDEKEIALKVMDWGKDIHDVVDYTDMIWIPNKLNLSSDGLSFDYIMADECQDINKAERMLILKCLKDDSRLICVGDTNQCIYTFAGSDPDSFKELKNLPNTISMPLSISYRCADNIVKFAQKFVPSIEKNNDGRLGEVKSGVQLEDVNDGDMVICRNNAPLLYAYTRFLGMGKKCYIRGKDIGSNLKMIVKSYGKDELNVDCKKDGLFARLFEDLFNTRNKIMTKFGVDGKTALTSPIIESKMDTIFALEILSEGINTSDELIAKIDDIFPKKDEKEGIALSTIHKAKGLEAGNVFVICNSLMPSKNAKKEWEVLQEKNLMYVAYTRAKNKLFFVSEDEFDKFNTNSQSYIDGLERIEKVVNMTIGRWTIEDLDEEKASSIIKRATKIENKHINMPTLGKSNVIAKPRGFASMLKKKKRLK